jgi:hypothetical protein
MFVTQGLGGSASRLLGLGFLPAPADASGSYVTLGQAQTASLHLLFGLAPAVAPPVEPPQPPGTGSAKGIRGGRGRRRRIYLPDEEPLLPIEEPPIEVPPSLPIVQPLEVPSRRSAARRRREERMLFAVTRIKR